MAISPRHHRRPGPASAGGAAAAQQPQLLGVPPAPGAGGAGGPSGAGGAPLHTRHVGFFAPSSSGVPPGDGGTSGDHAAAAAMAAEIAAVTHAFASGTGPADGAAGGGPFGGGPFGMAAYQAALGRGLQQWPASMATGWSTLLPGAAGAAPAGGGAQHTAPNVVLGFQPPQPLLRDASAAPAAHSDGA